MSHFIVGSCDRWEFPLLSDVTHSPFSPSQRQSNAMRLWKEPIPCLIGWPKYGWGNVLTSSAFWISCNGLRARGTGGNVSRLVDDWQCFELHRRPVIGMSYAVQQDREESSRTVKLCFFYIRRCGVTWTLGRINSPAPWLSMEKLVQPNKERNHQTSTLLALCAGKPSETRDTRWFPTKGAIDTQSVSISWRHHVPIIKPWRLRVNV